MVKLDEDDVLALYRVIKSLKHIPYFHTSIINHEGVYTVQFRHLDTCSSIVYDTPVGMDLKNLKI